MLADTQVINLANTGFKFPDGDSWTGSWDLILRAAEADHPPGRIGLGPVGEVIRGVGVHASAGITFDLASLRAATAPRTSPSSRLIWARDRSSPWARSTAT